ncbi:MAG: M24 family metallopeptidase [Candidatus Hodarchaeota archaeon]
MNKFQRAAKLLQQEGMDAWLIICNEDSDIHSPYFLGIKSHAMHFIFIDSKGQHEILAVQMEAPMIKKTLDNAGVKASVKYYSGGKELIEMLTDLLQKPRIAVNYGENSLLSGTTYADYLKVGELESLKKIAPGTEFISAANLIFQLRSVKSSEEIKVLRENAKITIEVLEGVPDWVKVGMTEKEVEARISYEYLKVGEPAFDTIVATCENSADPHHNSSKKKIQEGALLIDTGVRSNQVRSDVTWTFWAGGKPPEDFTRAYYALYESKKVATQYMKENNPMNLPGIKCREFLQKQGYNHEKLFIHGLGHALGYEVHDIGYRMSWKSPADKLFLKNSVYTNEPGLYWPGKYGLRLEDDILVAEEPELLTYNPPEPLII